MKIVGVSVYQVDLPLHEGRYAWSGGKAVEVFDSTVVRVETDSGVTGHGEVCPLGPAYLPSYAAGARAGIAEIAGDLLGLDPRQLGAVNREMDRSLKGHPYVKSALDMACWDILGQDSGLPLCDLLGGRYQDSVPLYRAISQDTPERCGLGRALPGRGLSQVPVEGRRGGGGRHRPDKGCRRATGDW